MKVTIKKQAGMYLRAGPGTNYEIVGRVPAGGWVTGFQAGLWTGSAGGYLYVGDADDVLVERTAHDPLPGVDVSHWQGVIDWRLMKEEGVQVAYIKVSEGTKTVDPQWRENHKWARAYGLKVGPYHFVLNGKNPEVQAVNFANQYKSVTWDYPPAADFEDNAVVPDMAGKAKHFLEAADAGVVYTNASWWDKHVGWQSWAAAYRLWVAHWDVGTPALPLGWDVWHGWQWTVTEDAARYGAQSDKLDLNHFMPV